MTHEEKLVPALNRKAPAGWRHDWEHPGVHSWTPTRGGCQLTHQIEITDSGKPQLDIQLVSDDGEFRGTKKIRLATRRPTADQIFKAVKPYLNAVTAKACRLKKRSH